MALTRWDRNIARIRGCAVAGAVILGTAAMPAQAEPVIGSAVSASVTLSRFAEVVATLDTSPPQYFTGRGTASSTVTASAATQPGAEARARALARGQARAEAIANARASATALANAADPSRTPRLSLVAVGDPAFRPCDGPLPKPNGGQWKCSFDDEFSGTALDPRKWTPVTTQESRYAAGDSCFVDDPHNIALKRGTLRLTVRKTAPITCPTTTGPITTTQTAANVASMNKFSQAYGRFAVRAKFPATTIAGLHAALWLWPQSYTYGMLWPLSGEIDIAELYTAYPDRVIPYLHYVFDPATVDVAAQRNVPTNNYCLVKHVGRYHEYAVVWTPDAMKIIFDKTVCMVDHWSALDGALTPLKGSAPFDQPFFIALTQAVGVAGNAFDPNKTPLPGTTTIDWVRVWK